MTYLDLVKKHIPDANDAYADYILWEKTSFPIVRNPEILEEQIMNFAKEVQK
jgi:hypothetical protein